MKHRTTVWLIVAASLVLVGCLIFGGVMSVLKWDFSKLSTAKYENNDYEIIENYKNISIITDTADIALVPSENLTTSVSCYEQTNKKHSVTVKDDTLVIEVVDTRKWYEYIGIHFGAPKITINLPQGEYGLLSVKSNTGDVEISKDFTFESIDISESTGNVTNYASALEVIKIKTSTGSIRVDHISAGALDLSVSTGEIIVSNAATEGDVTVNVSTGKTKMTDVECKNLISSGNTGDISLEHVIAAETFSIERSTGDVKFGGSDAAEIFVKTDTGDVTGNFLTEKVFMTQTDTGDIHVPKTTTGGRCEIVTDTGDIKITID